MQSDTKERTGKMQTAWCGGKENLHIRQLQKGGRGKEMRSSSIEYRYVQTLEKGARGLKSPNSCGQGATNMLVVESCSCTAR